ncbi:MAG: Gfo/Idh/MocA family protein [Bacillota bacterium]
MGQPLRVGIIGYGSIGKVHEEVLSHCEGVTVAAIAGRSAARPPGLTADWHADYRELLRRPDIDLVVICTPSGLHGPQALEALEAGKHVVIEKPMALRLDEARAVIGCARRRGLFLSVISQRRMEPPHRYLKEAIASGRLGRPVLGEALVRWYRPQSYYDSADWRGTLALDGGALMNQGIHLVDLLLWLMGPVTSVSAHTATRTHRMEAEDTATASLRFESGALGLIAATTAAHPGFPAELNLFFERGSVLLSGSQVLRWEVPDLPPPPKAEPATGGASDPRAIGNAGHLAQWQEILDALRYRRRPLVAGEDGLAALALVLAIYESSQTGRAVRPGLEPLGRE